MYSLNEVTIDHIQQRKDIQLSQLLHLLLRTEAASNVLDGWDVSVPFNITTGDAGADGKMRWTGNPPRTTNIPNNFTIFQNKATELIPSKCFEEILETEKAGQPRKLKAQIKQLVEANGCYIFFTTQPLVDKGKEERIREFRRAIAEAGHANADTIQIEVYDANRIKDWVNQNIETVLFVQKCNGITRPAKFITWEELGLALQAKETPFQTNEVTKENIFAIQSAIGAQKAMRISGHSGLGKTRLIYETLKAEGAQPSVTPGLAYYDLGLATGIDEITNFLVSHRTHQQGTIVIDNCDAQTHVSLAKLVKSQGNLKIITIGFDDSREIEDPKIKLDRNNQRDLVSAIVEQKLSVTHDVSDKGYVKTVSEGYPWMAVKFCSGILQNGMSNLSQYSLDEFIRKLLFKAPAGNEEYAVISACSVFSAFGFYDDSLRGLVSPEIAQTLQAQMDFIRTEIYDGTLTDSRFREICLKFRKEDIIEKRGTFYMVKPSVLAIHLAAHWMTITSPDKIRKVIESLKNISLEEKFIDRLSDLDQLDKAKDMVSELWGEDGFFGSAEVLSTEWGSLLFRYVVEVNPQATMEALDKVFAGKTTEETRAMITSRRNLVWALEKLVFRQESFEKGARLLYRFAVAENETWANNATNQFVQLFQLFLPGTEVNYNDRINIIRWGMKRPEEGFARIGVLALGRGLMYDHFSRGGGAENQGSSVPLKDYTPSTWQEIFDYWKDILKILVPIASTEGPLAIAARDVFVKAIRSLAKYGQIQLVHDTIKTIHGARQKFWPEALDGLKRTVNYEKQLPDSAKNLIKELILELTPKDLKTQLYLTVSKPEWTYKTPEDFRGEKQVQKANELAELIIKDGLPIEHHLHELLRNEQRQGFAFGKRLGEISTDPQTLAQQMLKALADIHKAEQNPEVLAGLLIGAGDEKLTYSIYHQMMSEEKIAHHAFYLARVARMGINEVEKLFEVIDRYNLTVSYFSSFQYGGVANNFSAEEIIKLGTKLKSYGMSGRWTGLAIVFAYCYDHEERFQQCTSFLKVTVGEANMGLTDENIHTIESFHWSEVVSKLLTDKKDPDFAKIIMRQIVEMYSSHSLVNQLDHYIPKVMQVLLDNYFDETWNILGDALLGNNYIFLINIRSAVGTKNGWMGGNGVLFENPDRNEKIFEWCKQHPDLGPKRIANMMPLQATDNEQTTWNVFSRGIIDTFGNQQSVLNELSANMGTYGSVGSTVDYLEMLKILVTELVDHPFEDVKDWAGKYLRYLDKEIKREQLSNEEDLI